MDLGVDKYMRTSKFSTYSEYFVVEFLSPLNIYGYMIRKLNKRKQVRVVADNLLGEPHSVPSSLCCRIGINYKSLRILG